jgi:hypothetical protein
MRFGAEQQLPAAKLNPTNPTNAEDGSPRADLPVVHEAFSADDFLFPPWSPWLAVFAV